MLIGRSNRDDPGSLPEAPHQQSALLRCWKHDPFRPVWFSEECMPTVYQVLAVSCKMRFWCKISPLRIHGAIFNPPTR
jgi:hypothetical protein